ncbi:MAG: isochorismate synthase [Kiritimatiellae bacterium]|nr:isochorismate synthase [Kiritimatiellia bacterium]
MNTLTRLPLAAARAGAPDRVRAAFDRWANRPENLEQLGIRIEIPLEETDPLAWLCAQTHPVQCFWSGRDAPDQRAGVGTCHVITAGSVEQPGAVFDPGRAVLRAFGHGADVRYLGGFAFSPGAIDEAPWPRFGAALFRIPRVELVRDARGCRFAVNLFFQQHVHISLDETLEEVAELTDRLAESVPLPGIAERRDFPDQPGWEANVRAALDLIRSGLLDKVVLARKAVYRFEQPVPAAHILRVLQGVTANCYHFLLQPESGTAFMGTTPECLYRRRGDDLFTEALAGTRPRDEDPARDAALARELLESGKERREQELVYRDILRQLHLLCDAVEADEAPELLPLERKQHLISRIRGRLRSGVGDRELIQALHPTPAVGGSPRVNALKEIPRLEPFSRGGYAAPVGWFDLENAVFAVAIRSGLVRGARVNVYSGAGIVAGSDPAAEWQEIENKISDFVRVTQGGRVTSDE